MVLLRYFFAIFLLMSVSQAANITLKNISYDNENFTLDFSGNIDYYTTVYYIDADGDANNNSNCYSKLSGADYKVEHDRLYKCNNDTGKWKKTVAHIISYDDRQATIKRSDIDLEPNGQSQQLKVKLQLVNNNFHTVKVSDAREFSFENNNNVNIQMSKQNYTIGEDIKVTLSNLPGNDDDWVGIYKKGYSNDWKNVKAWKFTSGIKSGELVIDDDYRIDEAGNYEARLFYKNSFKLEDIIGFSIVKQNIDDDTKYLYQNLDIDVSSEYIRVHNNGKILMDTDRSVLNHSSDTFKITHTIEVEKGGFDIIYTVKNKTSEDKALDSSFVIPGINFGNNNGLNVLNTKTYFYPVHRDVKQNETININYMTNLDNENEADYKFKILVDDMDYPKSYSPVTVADNTDFAVGVSMMTSYLEDRIALSQQIVHRKDGKWDYIFKVVRSEEDAAKNNAVDYRYIKAHEAIKLKFSIRFASKKYWLMTLAPYKTYFNKKYTNKDITKSDTRPIIGLDLSYGSVAEKEGNRGYNYFTALNKYGFDNIMTTVDKDIDKSVHSNFTDRLSTLMKKKNYSRVMLWAMGGQFDKSANYNIPPQFMSNIPNNILTSFENTFRPTFENAGIDYGFWWGNSGKIPYKNGKVSKRWNPDKLQSFNLNNKNHRNFALHELQLANKRGAKEIGLDAFTNMKIEDQLRWSKKMKRLYPHMKFWEESVQSDYLHTELSLFLQPNVSWMNGSKNGSNYILPPLLATYLNPKAEVLIWLTNTWGDGRGGINTQYIEKLTKMGYTLILVPSNSNIYGNKPFIDISNIDTKLNTCHDGIDNDGDGKVDWPYDDGCHSAIDSEK